MSAMIRKLFLLAALCMGVPLAAQQRPPLYMVNGKERPAEEVGAIDTDEIERIDALPADEETIARFGPEAANGTILITLKYDSPAVFPDSLPFGRYIARQVRWDSDEPAARVVVRYKITAEGTAVVDRVLESTDNKLKRRVLKAVAEAPHWTPATKEGRAVESQDVLRIRLPEGKRMPGEPYIRIR